MLLPYKLGIKYSKHTAFSFFFCFSLLPNITQWVLSNGYWLRKVKTIKSRRTVLSKVVDHTIMNPVFMITCKPQRSIFIFTEYSSKEQILLFHFTIVDYFSTCLGKKKNQKVSKKCQHNILLYYSSLIPYYYNRSKSFMSKVKKIMDRVENRLPWVGI